MYKKLLFIARQNGYIVKSYSKSLSLLILLNLDERAQKSSSVSLKDENGNIYIFIDDALPEYKQMFALAHEIGHNVLEHVPTTEKKTQQEHEADLFAHYLLDTKAGVKNITKVIGFFSVILCLCIITITVLYPKTNTPQSVQSVSVSSASSPVVDCTICYHTKYGEVYHIYRDCSYIRNSKTVYTSTISTCGKERMCSRCEQRYKERK